MVQHALDPAGAASRLHACRSAHACRSRTPRAGTRPAHRSKPLPAAFLTQPCAPGACWAWAARPRRPDPWATWATTQAGARLGSAGGRRGTPARGRTGGAARLRARRPGRARSATARWAAAAAAPRPGRSCAPSHTPAPRARLGRPRGPAAAWHGAGCQAVHGGTALLLCSGHVERGVTLPAPSAAEGTGAPRRCTPPAGLPAAHPSMLPRIRQAPKRAPEHRGPARAGAGGSAPRRHLLKVGHVRVAHAVGHQAPAVLVRIGDVEHERRRRLQSQRSAACRACVSGGGSAPWAACTGPC